MPPGGAAHRKCIGSVPGRRFHMQPLWRRASIPLEILGTTGLVCGGHEGAVDMMDILMIAIGSACFVAAIAYAYACDRF